MARIKLVTCVACANMFILLLSFSSMCSAAVQLGPAKDDKVATVLFADMGKVYVDEFRIDGLNATLDVKIEDTEGIDEYWLLDFQPYQYNINAPPIIKETAYLSAARTSQCSSVEQDKTWAEEYFDDDFFQNHTATGDKLLFTSFWRGNGVQNGVRSDEIVFEGDMDTFLACQRTDGSDVWESNIYDEEIEFNTVLYATNLRPQFSWEPDTSLQIPAVGFLQNNIHLIWRLARTAMVNFILTSESIPYINLFALFDYAIVEPVLEPGTLTPIIEITRLYMGFTTYVPIEDSSMLVWVDNTVSYIPINPENALQEVVADPPSLLANTPLCNTVQDPEYCIQSWHYEFILLLDITQLNGDMPLDATGAFGFDFDVYACGDVASSASCAPSADFDEPFHVLIDLTLQSTVSALDEAGDGITVEVVKFTNDAGVDVRNGVVNNLENVTMEVVFYPAFLREEYILEMQLFMVCKGEELAGSAQGCLAAPEEERYSSFVAEDFSFTYDAADDPDFQLHPTEAPDFESGSGWAEWGFWSDCSVTCGSGARQRSRLCDSNTPDEDCIGGYTEVAGCIMVSCDVYRDDHGQVLRYESTDRDMGWLESQLYCQSKGGVLTSIDNTGLQQHLLRQYQTQLDYPKAIPLSGLSVNQSSTSSRGDISGEAYLAIDGNTNAVYNDNSCSQTISDGTPQWWEVELAEEQCITMVTIVNRADCCHEDLINVRVGIDNIDCGSPISERQAGPGVWVDVVCAEPICGTVISIHTGSNNGGLTLCEVMAYGHEMQDPGCYTDPLGIDYRGYISVTASGKECQTWTLQSPHSHDRTPANYPNSGLGDHNYCRNPDGEPGAWCYAMDSENRWELCDVGQPQKSCENTNPPVYWIGGYEGVAECEDSLTGSEGDYGSEDSCAILSECNGLPMEEMCNKSLRAICEYESVLVFHAVGGNHESVFNLWESSESHSSVGGRVDEGHHYKSHLVEEWDQQVIQVDEVKIVLKRYEQDVLEMTFDGTGSDKYDWFSQDRLIDWPYDDIKTSNSFSIFGFIDSPYRYFYMKERFGSCRNDFGWFVVLEEPNPDRDFNGCPWELFTPPHKPAFLYSDGPGSTNWLQGAVADSFQIYIKYNEQMLNTATDEEAVPDGFALALRGVSGSGQELLGLWQSSSYSDNGGRVTPGQHYKSVLVERWNRMDIMVEEVLLQLKRDGDVVLEMLFDGTDSDKYNWFSPHRVISSPFSDLSSQHNYFSVNGHPGIFRHFYINKIYNGCPNDEGWLVVIDHGNFHPCQWDLSYGEAYPKFLYSNQGDSTNWLTGNVGVADEFLIFIKYTDTPPPTPIPTFPAPIVFDVDSISPPVEGRELNAMEYDIERKVHHSEYTNRPLADERLTTTITSVYLLVPLNKKRKRDIRHRRSLLASIEVPQLRSTTFGSSGCPDKSTFNPLEFSCACWEGYRYNLRTFTCQSDDVYKDGIIDETRNNTGVIVNEDVMWNGLPSEACLVGYNGRFLMLTVLLSIGCVI